jgi:hypothetical protein
MNKVLNRLLLSSFFTLLIVAFMIQPVVAWSDVGVEYFDDYYDDPGTWYPSENQALEGGSLGAYDFQATFIYYGVDTTADTYKVRVNFTGSDQSPPESINVYYKWGSGSWTFLTTISSQGDSQYTIADATSTTLYVRLEDYSNFFDFLRDRWSFGGEPELWMYWN